MSSSEKAKIALALALLLLCLSGIAAGFAIDHLYRAENLIRHTYDLEVAIGDVESSLTSVGRSRVAYLDSATPQSLQTFEDSVKEVSVALARIRQLSADNPTQQAMCDRLEINADQRVAISRESVELKQQNQSTPEKQLQLTSAVARTAYDTAAISHQMRGNEDSLLQQRSNLSKRLFSTILGILSISLLLAAVMFGFHYLLLTRELHERQGAENQLRQLSLQLMRVQDEERRRFARELHDGLGQNLAGAKMMADGLLARNPGDGQIEALAAILMDAASQTRAISYLFHPPLLDEVGFCSAATWMIEGYAQRTGVAVSASIPRSAERLPRSVELALYRVLQESLNNIHRHSGSLKAEVSLQTDVKCTTLRIRDYGRGIPTEMLASFHANGGTTGVGLTGMKERVREQGGTFEIQSKATGTEIVVRIPVNPDGRFPSSTPAESVLEVS